MPLNHFDFFMICEFRFRKASFSPRDDCIPQVGPVSEICPFSANNKRPPRATVQSANPSMPSAHYWEKYDDWNSSIPGMRICDMSVPMMPAANKWSFKIIYDKMSNMRQISHQLLTRCIYHVWYRSHQFPNFTHCFIWINFRLLYFFTICMHVFYLEAIWRFRCWDGVWWSHSVWSDSTGKGSSW